MKRRKFMQGVAAFATALVVPKLGAAENRWGVFRPTGNVSYYFGKVAPLGEFNGQTTFKLKGIEIHFPKHTEAEIIGGNLVCRSE